MTGIVITAAKRTAIGKFMGSLSDYSAPELGKLVIEAVLNENNLDKNLIDELIMGQVLTGGSGQNPARQSSILAGLPIEKSALTVNQVCGSGLRAVSLGTQSIMTNQSEIVIAGGQESMTNAHHTINVRNGLKMGDGKLKDSMIIDGLWCAMNDYHMGTTAENISEKYNISKQDQDEFATLSQNKAEEAQKKNKFESEILSVSVKQKKETVDFNNDEFPRHGSTLEKISLLKPVFKKDGSVTAGNASGLNDGAAALTLMSEETAKKLSITPLVRVVSWATTGVDPAIMGIGPVPATKKALKIANWKLDDVDLIEANEAFAAQSLAVSQEMKWDMSKVNVNGGAIALGHPIGASGARILVTLIHELIRSNKSKGLATLCIGGGQGIAMCIERI
ncbi:MAG: acetyl-CoA C-acyltransferase [Rickettsiales bacterium]|nr:acetyl-CoA C-acyltransferase [Rickettsiales bacterium]RPG13357.1 MAG: acetyl-CoA C-acetyltransferase [Pelagibacteraceae bacterium TMED195]|tara:strand:+ start:1969 stop:3144 length:1176 start_codon:yes stop_codon:yes gene_type:complete